MQTFPLKVRVYELKKNEAKILSNFDNHPSLLAEFDIVGEKGYIKEKKSEKSESLQEKVLDV